MDEWPGWVGKGQQFPFALTQEEVVDVSGAWREDGSFDFDKIRSARVRKHLGDNRGYRLVKLRYEVIPVYDEMPTDIDGITDSIDLYTITDEDENE